MIIQNISMLLLVFASASSAGPLLRGNIASVERNNREYFRSRRVTGDADSINKNPMKRMILDDTQTIPVIMYPFTLTISPTAQPLQQFQIDEIGDTIESLVFTKLSRSGDAGLSLVSSVQLSGVSSVTFTPSQKIDDWKTQMSKSVLEFKAGVAQTYFSIYHDTPTPNQLATAVESIMKQDLMTSIRANVNGLEWVQVVNVQMHLPYSTLSPTAAPIQPTLAPVGSPSSSPTIIQSQVPTVMPTTVTFAKPTVYPTAQKPSSFGQVSTAAPTEALGQDLTTMPTFEKIAFNNNNNSSSNNDFKDGGNKSDDVQSKAPAILGAISCAVLIVGFAVVKRRRRGRILSNHSETDLIPDKDSYHEDGDSTVTPNTNDGYITPNGAQDDCETFPPKQVERLRQRGNSKELSVDLDCISTRKQGSYVSLPRDFHQGPNLEDVAVGFQSCDVSQTEIVSLQNMPISTQRNDQSQTPEIDSPFEPTENNEIGCSMQKLSIMSFKSPTLDDFFSPCSNVFRGDDASDCDHDDKSSVHLNPLATSSVFEHFDENEALWDTKGDDSSVAESNRETASNAGSVRRVNSDGSVGGDDNEFILDDSWDPDDTDSASESPSFGIPQFEPIYDDALGNNSDESSNVR